MYASRWNFRVLKEIGVKEHDGDVRFFTGSGNKAIFVHAQWKICNITLIYRRIAKMFASFRKSGPRNTMVASNFSPEVRNASDNNYWNSSFIVDLAMGQIPRSTERISSLMNSFCFISKCGKLFMWNLNQTIMHQWWPYRIWYSLVHATLKQNSRKWWEIWWFPTRNGKWHVNEGPQTKCFATKAIGENRQESWCLCLSRNWMIEPTVRHY